MNSGVHIIMTRLYQFINTQEEIFL